ncbi:molybdopterin-binding protein [Anaerolentibacter hominis]|uniref:molybdopterin-binding protein n=1 Tax=Anaerolentibacter hominis TaxID=3079009 RepID=UPI0031B83F82
MIGSAVIIPTGNEIKEGIVLDTDSPGIMARLLALNPCMDIRRIPPVLDSEDRIWEAIDSWVKKEVHLIVLIGGSGGGHRFSDTLGKDFTHTVMADLLEDKYCREIYGKNGHLWSKLIIGTTRHSLLINVPGPYEEAMAAIGAFCHSYEEGCPLSEINLAMADAVIALYDNQVKPLS